MPDVRPTRDLRRVADHWNQQDPDRTALVLGDDRRSWQQLVERIDAVASALARDGVVAGDRVALLDKNDLEYFEVLLGAARIGAVLVAVNWRLAPPEIAYVLSDAKATHCFVGPDFAASIDTIRADAPSLRHVIGLGDAAPSDTSYAAWVASPTPTTGATSRRRPDDPSALHIRYDGTSQGRHEQRRQPRRVPRLGDRHVPVRPRLPGPRAPCPCSTSVGPAGRSPGWPAEQPPSSSATSPRRSSSTPWSTNGSRTPSSYRR